MSFLCSIVTPAMIMSHVIPLDEGQLAEIELRRQAKQSSKLDCEHVKVLFTNANVAAGQSTERPDIDGVLSPPKAFDRQGGVILLSGPKICKIVFVN